MTSKSPQIKRSWPDYAAVWRWHFYAGLLCLPFFCWLAMTGSIYLFRPDIEAWLDRPYEALNIEEPRAAPSSEARAAIVAVPGSLFSRYEPPTTPSGAAQVIVVRDGHPFRVYVHPVTLQAMHIEEDDHRVMDVIAHLHGQLLLGDPGSMVVEVAGSWGVVMILTGLYLWIPRGAARLGGLIYPRIRQRGRIFWRDLHSVTGLWVSFFTLFLLLSGLPWSSNWGNYLTWVRNHWEATSGTPDWPIGTQLQPDSHNDASHKSKNGARDITAGATTSMALDPSRSRPPQIQSTAELRALDKVVPLAARLNVPHPIWISPPALATRDWTILSRIQNRPMRVTYTVNPETGVITGIDEFGNKNIVDKVVNVMIAAHEGQLFGRLNQAILLLTAAALLLVSITAAVMWWRRRPAHMLGAPQAAARPQFSTVLVVTIGLLALSLPLFGLSLLLVLVIDRTLLRRLPAVQLWLGLSTPMA